MHNYLVDEKSKKVLLYVNGPIKVKPGQRIIQSSAKIPVSLARYDCKAGEVVQIADSTKKRRQRKMRQERASRTEQIFGDAARFHNLLQDQSPEIQELFKILLRTPRAVLIKVVGEEEVGARSSPEGENSSS
tara:strand:- start:1052 stop:1447 length:396 start_codon:yes stop_codon:yes gene_type:complete